METITITVLDEETAEQEVRLPARFEVCRRCEGKGKHDNPAFANGITSDDWNGPDWDDESRQHYLRGVYDVVCTECKGDRVVLTAFVEVFTPEQRAVWEAHTATCRELAALDASEHRLRLMESGGY